MQKTFHRILVVSVLFISFWPFVLQAEQSKFRIGAIIALTGDAATVGQAFKNGFQLAYERLPSEIQEKIEVVYEDDAMQPRNTLSAYRRLQAFKPVDMVVTVSTPTGFALMPVTEREQVPMINLGSNTGMFTGARYAMSIWVPMETLAELVVQEAHNRGYKKIARINATQEGRLNASRNFDHMNQGRISVAIDEEVLPTERDFRSLITRIQQRNDIDAVYVNLIFGQVGLFVKQAKDLGLRLPFFNSELFGDKKEIELSQGALCGEWYVNGKNPTPEFVRDYEVRFPGASTFSAPNAYDLMGIIGKAVRESDNKDELFQYFRSVKNYDGVLGTYSALPTNKFSLPGEVLVVKEGCK